MNEDRIGLAKWLVLTTLNMFQALFWCSVIIVCEILIKIREVFEL